MVTVRVSDMFLYIKLCAWRSLIKGKNALLECDIELLGLLGSTARETGSLARQRDNILVLCLFPAGLALALLLDKLFTAVIAVNMAAIAENRHLCRVCESFAADRANSGFLGQLWV